MDIKSDFIETLSELMDEQNLTSDALGNAIGVNGSVVRCWKQGKNKLYLSNALKLAEFFSCSLEFLIGRTDERLSFTPKPYPPFHDRLLQVMKEQGKSRYSVVKETAFSNGHFSKWKAGSDPYLESLVNLSNYLNCTLDYLVGRET